ncbi:MAG: DUF87 domain-containing protein, partial [Nitrosopumilus sp. B06]
MDKIAGQVVGGKFGDIIIRQKSGNELEIGDLLISDEGNSFLILQVFELEYGSQIEDKGRQMISGVNMEEGMPDVDFYEQGFVNYVLARIKPLARVYKDDAVKIPKSLPSFFNTLRMIENNDLKFLQKDQGSIFVGYIRSGSKVIKEAEVWLPAEDVFTHHVMIPATTGRGKSNLVKTIMWHVLDSDKVGALVLDAHDEYYGRQGAGLKDHKRARENLAYYTPSTPPVGASRLTINLQSIKPEHFEGIVDFSDAQFQAIRSYYWKQRDAWLTTLMLTSPEAAEDSIASSTMSVIQRKMRLILGLDKDQEGRLISKHEVFDSATKGFTTVDDIVNHIESGKVVILDTSRLGDEAEL